MKTDWKQELKQVFSPMTWETGPVSYRWLLFCYHRPIWIGLPLIPLLYLAMVEDIIYIGHQVIKGWGK